MHLANPPRQRRPPPKRRVDLAELREQPEALDGDAERGVGRAAVEGERVSIVPGTQGGPDRRREHAASAATEQTPRAPIAVSTSRHRSIEEPDRHVDGEHAGIGGGVQDVDEAPHDVDGRVGAGGEHHDPAGPTAVRARDYCSDGWVHG